MLSLKVLASDSLIVDLHGTRLASDPNTRESIEGKGSRIVSVQEPCLVIRKTALLPSKGTFLVLPGGAYHVLAINHEGHNVADYLNSQGYDAAILEYSIGQGPEVRQKALNDAVAAVDLIRGKSGELGLGTASLGVIGFSAGGHLTAHLIHELGEKSPIANVVLVYPAYLEEAAGSNGLNDSVTPPKGASRIFVVIGENDRPEWVGGSKAYEAAAKSVGHDTELHLLPQTGHGFGIRPDLKGASAGWTNTLTVFLEKGKTM